MSYIHLFGVNVDMNFISTLSFVLLITMLAVLIKITNKKGGFTAYRNNDRWDKKTNPANFHDPSNIHYYTNPAMRDFFGL